MNLSKTSRVATGIAAASLALAASGDGYQYIISGDPVAAATAGVSAARSTPPGPLEMRQHVATRSTATALTSKKPLAFMMIIR